MSITNHVNYCRLDDYIAKFYELVANEQNTEKYPTTEISFKSGFIYENEGYKYEVFKKANDALSYASWEESMIGNGDIAKAVINTMHVRSDGRNQNLIDWRDIQNAEQVMQDNIVQSENLLFQLYKTSNQDSLLFENACKLFGRKYPLISYLFFIKNKEEYITVRPEILKKNFDVLEIETESLKKCTWDNYQKFLSIAKVVQSRLQDTISESVSLLDTHSFIWMLWRLRNITLGVSGKALLEDSDPYVTVVADGSKEGRRLSFYSYKYERSAKNRNAAIRIHGLTCMACGINFEEKYGEIGKGFIEVHHIKPLNSLEQEVVIEPATDLVCLCANCHRMIHRKKNYIMSVEELRNTIMSR